jgi:hypothetical protein
MCKDKIKAFKVYIAYFFSTYLEHLWLIGSLFKANRKTYAEALYEFTYLLLWSILPFALGTLTLYVASDSNEKDLLELGLSTFRNGELLVFTISMLAPILYMTLYDPDRAGPFPHKLPISTVVALIVVTCAALFALLKAHAVNDIKFVFNLSVILTLLALIFRYLALVYNRIRMYQITETDFRSDQSSFISEYKAHIDDVNSQSAENFTMDLENHLRGQE